MPACCSSRDYLAIYNAMLVSQSSALHKDKVADKREEYICRRTHSCKVLTAGSTINSIKSRKPMQKGRDAVGVL
jgi:hypothetical protein